MQIKKASFAGWLWAGLAFVVLTLLSVSAVFAYTSKLSFTMPVSFKVKNCTINYVNVADNDKNELVFSSNGGTVSSNFLVRPVTENTLEISCAYSSDRFLNNAITFSIDDGFTLELTKLEIYDAVAFDKNVAELNNSNYVSNEFDKQKLTITLNLKTNQNPDGLVPEEYDNVVFTIKVT